MKKAVVTMALALMAGSVVAQDQGSDDAPLNKKGHEILPKKGDIGLGFSVSPFLDMVFTAFSNNYTGASNLANSPNGLLVGKYFLDNKTAIRARIGISTTSGAFINNVQNSTSLAGATTADQINAALLDRVEDKMSYRNSTTSIIVGYEKRRGYRRLQGIFGGQLGFSQFGQRQSFTYGNSYSDTRTTHYTDFNFSGSTINPTVMTANPSSPLDSRPTEIKSNGGFGFFLGGFIGVEYFICSKISVGGEFGLNYGMQFNRAVETTNEVFRKSASGTTITSETLKDGYKHRYNGFTTNTYSQLILMFYF